MPSIDFNEIIATRATPVATGSSMVEVDSKKDKEKKKRRKVRGSARLPSSEMTVEHDNKEVKPSSKDREASRAKPLASHSTTPNSNSNTQYPLVEPYHPPRCILVPTLEDQKPSSSSNPNSNSTNKIQKLESKVEKQRTRLKDAETKVIKGEEKARKDQEKIQSLEHKIRIHEAVLRAQREEVASLKLRAADHAKVGPLLQESGCGPRFQKLMYV